MSSSQYNHFDPAFRMTRAGDLSLVTKTRLQIQAWIDSECFRELLDLYRARIDWNGTLDETLEQLEEFSDHWDFRRKAREQGVVSDDNLKQGIGSARWLSSDSGLDEGGQAKVRQIATQLGLVRAEEPTKNEYHYILVLGGARLSCQLRPRRAAEIIRQGLRTGGVALLGAARPVGDTERDATDSYAPGAVDEFDLIVAGSKHEFGFDTDPVEDYRHDDVRSVNSSWRIQKFHTTFAMQPLDLMAVSAPSSAPDTRRANSADTIAFFLERAHAKPGDSLLLITSQIYVPYVQLEALRDFAVPLGLFVETIGFPGDRMPELQGLTNTNHYLQEIRSAIQAAARFCRAHRQ
jgi:hypothetical protein